MVEIEHLAYLAEIDRAIEEPERVAASACSEKPCRRARACRRPATCTHHAMESHRIELAIAAEEAAEEALKARRTSRRRSQPGQDER
jgi:hypothetical protein